MKKLYYDSPGFENELRALADRPGYPPEIEPHSPRGGRHR